MRAPSALLVAVALCLGAHVAHAACSQALEPDIARRLLFDEPNQMLAELGKVSDDEGALTRTFLSPAHKKAAALLQSWMATAGMRTWLDDVANVHGRADGAVQNTSELLTGSHYDTVVDGGRYDGALGIIVGIAAVKAFALEESLCRGLVTAEKLRAVPAGQLLDVPALLGGAKGAEPPALLPEPVHVIGFSDEEGIRFQSTFLGSRAVAGDLKPLLAMTDREGLTLRAALEAAGYSTSTKAVAAMRIPSTKARAYVEVHIEQGPVLEGAGQPLGVVAGIAGQTRLFASLVGEQGHAGTVPMAMRKDPMPAAARVIARLEELCSPTRSEDNRKSNLVCTVGAIHVYPNAGNVIPRYTNFTIDIRGQFDANRLSIVRELREFFDAVCAERELGCSLELKNEAPSVHSDAGITQGFKAAAESAAATFQQLLAAAGGFVACTAGEGAADGAGAGKAEGSCAAVYPGDKGSAAAKAAAATADSGDASAAPAPVLVSGAGHDAMVMADLTKMGMLFVRCRGGISHSPDEYASPEDVAVATIALRDFFMQQTAAEMAAES